MGVKGRMKTPSGSSSPERNTCHSLSVTSIHTGQYRTVQYGTVQYGTVQYGTVKTFLKEAAFILGLDIQGPRP